MKTILALLTMMGTFTVEANAAVNLICKNEKISLELSGSGSRNAVFKDSKNSAISSYRFNSRSDDTWWADYSQSNNVYFANYWYAGKYFSITSNDLKVWEKDATFTAHLNLSSTSLSDRRLQSYLNTNSVSNILNCKLVNP